MFTKIVDANGGLGVKVTASATIGVTLPPLSVPLMSISKQVEDLLKKVMLIKEIIR